MPHETPVTDVGMFRTVLHRLGIETEMVNVPAHRIRNEYCPCIAVNGRDSLVFIQSVDADGTAQIFDSKTAAWRTVNRQKLLVKFTLCVCSILSCSRNDCSAMALSGRFCANSVTV